ncbi:MAG: flagellar FlbD family protein [bacterium]
MNQLTKLTLQNGSEIFVNPDQIVNVETIPETKITLVTGQMLFIREGIKQVLGQTSKPLYEYMP